MWLINASTMSLERFYGDEIPDYAILSHTWGDAEVSFQEFMQASETRNDRVTSKAGYRKITATCDWALKDGYNYAWVDTCCIDKTSSAELTEAINSMFGWYRQSKVCYAYLGDLVLDAADVSSKQDHFSASFRQCRWFTRGWCLQELLAPRYIRFFNKMWQEVGVKSSLRRLISDITGIPQAVLTEPPQKDVQDFPIATRISWISKRQTTRLEDMSYSLLGVLNINMPMLYGEGHRAFLRLQEEVIRKYNDLSIFAWTGSPTASGFMPMLAAEPSSFVIGSISHHTEFTDTLLGNKLSTQFSLGNQGVFFPNAKLHYQNAIERYRHQYLLYLNCLTPAFQGSRGKMWCVVLQKIGPGIFVRLHDHPDRLKAFRKQPRTAAFYEPVCILNDFPRPLIRQLVLWERNAVRLRWKPWEKLGRRYWHVQAAQPRAIWDLAANQFLIEMADERNMHIEFVPGNYQSNPNFNYFVLVIQIGEGKKRLKNTKVISARVVSADVWRGVNARTTLGFRAKESHVLEMLPPIVGEGESDRISLVGYDIKMSVQFITAPNERPYHLIYLDWELATN